MKANILFLIIIFIISPIFSQEIIELQDVSTTITGTEQELQEDSLPDFIDILPIPEDMLPELETNLPDVESEQDIEKNLEHDFEEFTYFEGKIGGGYPSLFLGDFSLSRSENNNFYNFDFFHETVNGYGLQESNKGFFNNQTELKIDGTVNFTQNLNLDFVGKYENLQFGLQSLSPIFYSTNLQQGDVAVNLEFICNDNLQLYGNVGTTYSSWFASYVPSQENKDLKANILRLNVAPRLGLKGNSGIFTCLFEGGYDFYTSKGNLDSLVHRGDLLYYMDFRFGDFLLKSDLGLVFVDKKTLVPFSVGFEFSNIVEISISGGMKSSLVDIFNLEKNLILFNKTLITEQSQWFSSLDFMFPIGTFWENNIKVDFFKTAMNNNLVLPDYSNFDNQTGLYGVSNYDLTMLSTEYSMLFYFEKSQLNIGWQSYWLDLPKSIGVAPHNISLLYSFVPSKNNWGFSLWASMNFGGNRELLGDLIPDTGLSFYIRSEKSFKFSFELNDMVKLFTGDERTLHGSYVKNSGFASIFVSFYL